MKDILQNLNQCIFDLQIASITGNTKDMNAISKRLKEIAYRLEAENERPN